MQLNLIDSQKADCRAEGKRTVGSCRRHRTMSQGGLLVHHRSSPSSAQQYSGLMLIICSHLQGRNRRLCMAGKGGETLHFGAFIT